MGKRTAKPVVEAREVDCVTDRPTLWSVLSDTERMTRLVGGDPIRFDPTEDAGAARFIARGKAGGFSLEYEEAPFEWEYPRFWKIVRTFRKGPLHQLINTLTLTPNADGGTRARIELVMTPRSRWLRWAIKRAVRPILKTWVGRIHEVDDALQNNAPLPARAVEGLDPEALRRATELLRERSPALADNLAAFISQGDELELSQIRPYALAEGFDWDRRETLATCLHGVRSGLLQMRWGIVCPSCQIATTVIPSLSELGDHGSCHFCDIDFEVNLEDAVEALFCPSDAIRELDTQTYCSGGPARTPHVLSQVVLPAQGEAELHAPEARGHYRLFIRGGKARTVEVVKDGERDVHLTTAHLESTPLHLAPGATIHIAHPGDQALHAKLEEARESRRLAATAHDVTTMPGFRRDFSSELLKPGLALEVGRVGLLFTDLTGSTQLYTNVGDASAFSLVQDHFTLLFEIIERHGGSVVKTIGDAIMAVFQEEMSGISASLEILSRFETFRESLDDDHLTHVKLGFYVGPAYAVTANDQLDFFGQTVNIAARLQGEAGPGELILTRELGELAIERGVLPSALVIERYQGRLKGVAEPVAMFRIATASQ